MSEFQLYAFRSIDRPLTNAEQKEIGSWSSRANPSAYGATFQYHYGDFPKDIESVVKKYFDAGLYVADFGCKRLIFRVPKLLADWKQLAQYAAGTEHEMQLDVARHKDYITIDIDYNQEEIEEYIDPEEFSIDTFLPIREEILAGDFRALYIAWLAIHYKGSHYVSEWEEDEDDDALPPIMPPNMGKLTAAQRQLAAFLDLDKTILKAVAQLSKTKKTVETDYDALLDKLSDEEKHDFLLALANGKKRLDVALRKRLLELDGKNADNDLPRPTWEEIQNLVLGV